MIFLFFAIAIFFALFSWRKTKKFLNPITIFNSIWILVIFLYNFRLSYLMDELSQRCILIFIVMIISFDLSFIVIYFFTKKNMVQKVKFSNLIIKKRLLDVMFWIWLFIEIIETVYSKGVPLLWKLTGSPKTYFDYGIPSVHGFTNAFGLSLVMLLYYYFVFVKRKKDILIKMIIMALFYISLITRQVLISMAIEIVVISLLSVKKNPLFKIPILAFIGIIAFGLVGNVRTGYDAFLNVAMMKYSTTPFFIGFIWVYMYLTMSVANINKLSTLSFTHTGGKTIIAKYMPTIIRTMLGIEESEPDYLVTKAFNVSGFFADFYVSYGLVGVAVISIIFGVIGGYLFKKISAYSGKYKFYYAIYLQIIILSFFYNHLLYLPSGFQFVIIFIFNKFKVFYGVHNYGKKEDIGDIAINSGRRNRTLST